MTSAEFILKTKREVGSYFTNNDTLLRYIDSDLVNDPNAAMYENIFPYVRVPDTEEEAMTYVCYDVKVSDRNDRNNTVKMLLTVYIITHQSLMRIKKEENVQRGGTRIDLIAALCDNMFDGNKVLGFGEMKCISNYPDNVDARHRARVITYETESLNIRECGISDF